MVRMGVSKGGFLQTPLYGRYTGAQEDKHNSSAIDLLYVPMLHDSHFDGLVYREYCHELPSILRGMKGNLYLQA